MAKRKVPIGCMVVLGVLLTCAVCMFAPALMRARRASQAAVCLSNVRGLGQACKMYAIDHDEHFPGNLVGLYPDYVKDEQLFFCPVVYNSHSPKHIRTLNEATISYAIMPALNEADETPAETILVREKSIWNHESTMNVCYIDGHCALLMIDKIIEMDVDRISSGLATFLGENGRYPTNEEGLEILVTSGYLKSLPVDPFDRGGKRLYGYASKNVNNNWILTCYGPDEDRDIDPRMYSQGKLSAEDLSKLKTKLVLGMMAIKRTNGDIFRVGP